MRRLLVTLLVVSALAAIPACAQQFPPLGDDHTTSLGSFKIQVIPQYAGLFNGCPAFTNPILASPVMYDPGTVIGRSDALQDGSAADNNGVADGTAGTIVGENILFPPAGFPCAGAPAGCQSGAGTREIHTEVRSLKLVRLGGGLPVVRAGVWYDNPNQTTSPPSRISPGEVESQSGPNGAAANDLPGSSFFDIFVRVDIPACGNFPGGTVYNTSPLIVKNPNLLALPPRVVYLHDTSTQAPVAFLANGPGNPPIWTAGGIFGYIVLAGHAAGFSNSSSDVNEFTNFMNSQPVNCVNTASAGTASTSRNAAVIAFNPDGGGGGGGSPSPSPSPAPSPSPTPSPTPNPCTTTAP